MVAIASASAFGVVEDGLEGTSGRCAVEAGPGSWARNIEAAEHSKHISVVELQDVAVAGTAAEVASDVGIGYSVVARLGNYFAVSVADSTLRHISFSRSSSCCIGVVLRRLQRIPDRRRA